MTSADESNLSMCGKRRALCISLTSLATGASWIRAASAAGFSWTEANQRVADAVKPNMVWGGPQSGPAASDSKYIALCASNLRNGGVLGVALGVREATRVIGWNLRVFHPNGGDSDESVMIAEALASAPDALIVVGSDHSALEEKLKPFAAHGHPVIGWHAASQPGPIAESALFLNITSDPLEVARVAALAAMLPTQGRAGVVILTDRRYQIARVKADRMLETVLQCGGKVLEMIDMPMSAVSQRMASMVRELIGKYGTAWTHALAINDIYFDYAVPELIQLGLLGDRPNMVSAGDGSASAMLRILAGTFQTYTVAEPLNQQGWQIVDELNRRFAMQPPSEYVTPVHLVSKSNLDADGGLHLVYDPSNGYRRIYRGIWGRV